MPSRSAISLVALACLAPASGRRASALDESIPASSRRVEGRVLDADGWPLPGARVYVLPAAGTVPSGAAGRPVLETASDRDGHFVLEALGPGTYRVDIEAPDHQAAHVGIHIPESGGPPGPLEVHLWPVTTAARPEKEPPPSAPAVASSAHSPAPAATTPEDAASEASPQGASEVPAAPDSVPSEAAGHVGLADAVDRALAASQVPRAVALLEGVPEKRAADAELFFRVGDALLRSGETAEATRVLDEALDRDPDHVGARYARALARLGTGQLEGAREDFRRLLQLQPEGPYAEKARAALGELGAPAR